MNDLYVPPWLLDSVIDAREKPTRVDLCSVPGCDGARFHGNGETWQKRGKALVINNPEIFDVVQMSVCNQHRR